MPKQEYLKAMIHDMLTLCPNTISNIISHDSEKVLIYVKSKCNRAYQGFA